MRIIAGDVGGTNTRLALFEYKDDITCIKEQSYKNENFTSLHGVVRAFLKEEKEKVQNACFGIAGPVLKGRCKATNIPWGVDSEEMQEMLNIEHVYLLNDLEAHGYGIWRLRPEDFYTLNEGVPQFGNAALIAAGTGLGEAGLFWNGKFHIPFACEGGHTDFAPRDELEIMLFLYLQRKYGHVSYERLISGPGLYNIYQFLIDSKFEERNPSIEIEFKREDPAKVITEKALLGLCRACERALDIFISLYGAEAGNVALKNLSVAGIYIGGGIAPKILQRIIKSNFLQSVVDKGRFSSLIMNMPIKIILNDKSALLGCAEYIMYKDKGFI
jgi:glucokinase